MPKATIVRNNMDLFLENTDFQKAVLARFIKERSRILNWTESDVSFAFKAFSNHENVKKNPVDFICMTFQCARSDYHDFKDQTKSQILKETLISARFPISAKTLFRFFKYQTEFYNVSERKLAVFCGISDGTITKMKTAKQARNYTVTRILLAYELLPRDIRNFNKLHANEKKTMQEVLKPKHLSSFFRSKRMERMMSMNEVRQKSKLTMRMMSDLENDRQRSNLPFIVRQLCSVFGCSVDNIKNHSIRDEIKISPVALQKFAQKRIKKSDYYAVSKKTQLSFGGIQAFLDVSNPDNYKMKTLRSMCDFFNCTPRFIADSEKNNVRAVRSSRTP